MDEAQNQQNPTPGSKKTKYIIIGVVVVILLGIVPRFFSKKASEKFAENMIEKAIEKSSDGKASVDLGNGTVSVKTEEGSAEWGSTKLPENWPSDVPTYPDSKVNFSGASNQTNQSSVLSVMLQASDSVEKVLAFYKKELPDQGWKIETNYEFNGSAGFAAKKDNRTLSATIAGGDDQTVITLAVETKQ